MKKCLFIGLLLGLFSELFAGNSFFMGMRNQRFLFVGVQHNSYGFAFEQSLFNQDPEQQHGRIVAYTQYSLPISVTLWYILFGGMQYDQDYYEYGGEVAVLWAPQRYFQVRGRFQPFYDSGYHTKYGYLLQLQSYPFKEVGLYAGIKNIPDYRSVERRYFGGLLFDVGRLSVCPEISTPIHGSFEWTRMNLSFIYRFDFN
jgi:hypothetical protein